MIHLLPLILLIISSSTVAMHKYTQLPQYDQSAHANIPLYIQQASAKEREHFSEEDKCLWYMYHTTTNTLNVILNKEPKLIRLETPIRYSLLIEGALFFLQNRETQEYYQVKWDSEAQDSDTWNLIPIAKPESPVFVFSFDQTSKPDTKNVAIYLDQILKSQKKQSSTCALL